jgi:hypothetical protein
LGDRNRRLHDHYDGALNDNDNDHDAANERFARSVDH